MSGRSNAPDQDGGDAFRLALYAAVALVAGMIGLTMSVLVFGGGPADERRGGPISLLDHRGQPATEAIFEGQVSLVYFGFTHCPDICPLELVNMVQAQEVLRSEGRDAQVVFVSVDPARDTPEIMSEYVSAFGDDVIGLTGTQEQVADAADAWDVIYHIAPPTPGGDPDLYDVLHSNYMYAVDGDGRELWRFPGGTPPEVIAKRLKEVGA